MSPASLDILASLDARIEALAPDAGGPWFVALARMGEVERLRAIRTILADNLPRVEAQAVDMMRGAL